MKEKLKEKAKNIFENYGETIIITGSLFGAYLLGTKVGGKTTDLKLELGLSRVFAAKPELETLMLETIDELTKK